MANVIIIDIIHVSAGIKVNNKDYPLKVNNKSTKTKYESVLSNNKDTRIMSLTSFEKSVLLILSRFHTIFWCFYFWLWTGKWPLFCEKSYSCLFVEFRYGLSAEIALTWLWTITCSKSTKKIRCCMSTVFITICLYYLMPVVFITFILVFLLLSLNCYLPARQVDQCLLKVINFVLVCLLLTWSNYLHLHLSYT